MVSDSVSNQILMMLCEYLKPHHISETPVFPRTNIINFICSYLQLILEPDYVLRPMSDVEPVNVSSPGYPSTYRNNAYKLWTIQAPHDHVIWVNATIFDLDTEIDGVFIGDIDEKFIKRGYSSWKTMTGNRPVDDVFGLFHYRSRGPSIYIFFTSNYGNAGHGFVLELQANPTRKEGM